METVQGRLDTYRKGYQDGWTSVSGAGVPPPVLGLFGMLLELAGEDYYQSGYLRGRAEAKEKSGIHA